MIVILSFLLPGLIRLDWIHDIFMCLWKHEPSMELAFTSCAQSVSSASGMLSQEIESGIRKYT